MTVSDLDVFRSANVLVNRHGAEATIHAAMHADAMLEKGDLDGQRVWLGILKAAKDLLEIEPVGGAKPH